MKGAATRVQPDLAAAEARFKQQSELSAQILKMRPELGRVAALIMAGDLISASDATRMVQAGMPASKAVVFVGSFSRFEWAIDHLEMSPQELAEMWREADPDDVNPACLNAWLSAYRENGGTILDGPGFTTSGIYVWRGQPFHKEWDGGISWTTDPRVARKFAMGAGLRRKDIDGWVLQGWMNSADALGYLTKCGESEVICDHTSIEIMLTVRASSTVTADLWERLVSDHGEDTALAGAGQQDAPQG